MDCGYFGICSGCKFKASTRSDEKTFKLQHLENLIKDFSSGTPITFNDFPSAQRRRLDFTIADGNLGLWSHEKRKIIDIESCQIIQPELQNLLDDFRKIKWDIKKGSFRLRAGWQGLRGAWLDFANLDIKNLLQDQKHLTELLAIVDHVEIGQRHKSLVVDKGTLKLYEPEVHAWWSTLFKDQEVPLYSTIGAFTQPGRESNLWILRKLREWISKMQPSSILELGAGIGNMSFALADLTKYYVAIENDPANLAAFEFNQHKYPIASLELKPGNFHIDTKFPETALVLANPARSGLQLNSNSFTWLNSANFIYMSCFPDSWAKDCRELSQHGYKIQELHIINQFPLSEHYEILSLLSKTR